MDTHDNPFFVDKGDIDGLDHAYGMDVTARYKSDRHSRPKRWVFQPPHPLEQAR